MARLERRFYHRGKARGKHSQGYHRFCPEGGRTKHCDPFQNDPRPLPTPRPRRLSVPPPNYRVLLRLAEVTLDQGQSPFFSQLPLERRLACYKHMLCEAEGTFHIYPRPDKYSYTKCRQPEELDHRECWAALRGGCDGVDSVGGYIRFGSFKDSQFDTSPTFQKYINLNVLIACRKMYEILVVPHKFTSSLESRKTH
jgi:hypothetical protein